MPPAKCKSAASFGAKSKEKKKASYPSGERGYLADFQRIRQTPSARSPLMEPKCVCAERNVAQFTWLTARLSSLRVSLQNKPRTAQDHLAADASEVKHTMRMETLFARIARDRQNLHTLTIKSTQTLKKKKSQCFQRSRQVFCCSISDNSNILRKISLLESCSGASTRD